MSIERQVRNHESNWVWSSIPEERVELFHSHLQAIIDRSRAIGARPVLLTHASRFSEHPTGLDRQQLIALRVFYPRASTDIIYQFERAMNDEIVSTARHNNVIAIDIDKEVGKAPGYFADFSHFTDSGSLTMAKVLSSAILQITGTNQLSESRALIP